MLKSGLNIKASKAAQLSSIKSVGSVFDTADDDQLEDDLQVQQLQKAGRSSLKRAALHDDDEVYDYDGIYDSLKVNEKAAALEREQEKRVRKPKYMQNLLEAAETRKRDRLRAEDVKLQRERDAEGTDLTNVERFVTEAYRVQQEKARQEAQNDSRQGSADHISGGFAAFSQSVLASRTKQHDAAVQASFSAHRGNDVATTQLSVEEPIATLESKLGHKIALNDDAEIVDHRDLLVAGLNRPKKVATSAGAKGHRAVPAGRVVSQGRDAQIRFDRQQEDLRTQLREADRRDRTQEAEKLEALKRLSKRTKTETDVLSARERYLARKQGQ